MQDIEFLENQVKDTEYKIMRLAGEYDGLDKKGTVLAQEYCKRLEDLYVSKGENIKTIASRVVHYYNKVGILHSFGYIYDSIEDKYKQDNAKQLKKLFASLNREEDHLNMSIEDRVLEYIDTDLEDAKELPDSRKEKLAEHAIDKIKERLGLKKEEVTEEDFGVHQEEPPEGMQGPSAFSEAVRGTGRWFKAASERMDKIADEIETYKPQNEEELEAKAKDWYQCIGGMYKDPVTEKVFLTGSIVRGILHPIFMIETKAEADRKYSTSIFHWIGIIKNRIEQSKHGAGKMAENYITDAFGHVVYNKKLKPIKKSISRERVGDFEWPIVDMAIQLISANMGLMSLHDWLENDEGGYRRYRKEFLHDYFAEASMGSIKSGNPEYESFMRDYKKKQLEKFKDVNS